jgi:hypothetical protein
MPVAEEIERDDAVAALGQIAGEGEMHALGEQQAVEKDDRTLPRTVLCIGQVVSVVLELRHVVERTGGTGRSRRPRPR